ncbi:MAG: hypothetical protein NT040_16615 [Bacteroidetes bacterium]|nr:hypothetical protein [Bacteroidota bacterium]
MKTILKILVFFLLVLPSFSMAETKEIPFTLEDRDRIIRTEQKVEAINQRFESIDQRFESIDKRFEAMNKRFDQLFNFLWAIVGIFTSMMVSVFGFAFWDRKLSLAPMKRDNLKTLNALREFAEHQPKLREILKNAGLM